MSDQLTDMLYSVTHMYYLDRNSMYLNNLNDKSYIHNKAHLNPQNSGQGRLPFPRDPYITKYMHQENFFYFSIIVYFSVSLI